MSIWPWLTLYLPMVATSPTHQIDPAESVFALITHKQGVFSGMAHNHFIMAQPDNVVIVQNQDGSWQMSYSFKVEELKVDPTAVANAHFPALEKMELLDEAYGELTEKDRKKIRESMLDKGQLHAKKFAEIKAEMVELKAEPQTVGKVEFSHTMTVDMTIKGNTQRLTFAANLAENEAGNTVLTALAKAKFSDFGIKPYSAFLGAVANADEIEFYAVLELKPTGESN